MCHNCTANEQETFLRRPLEKSSHHSYLIFYFLIIQAACGQGNLNESKKPQIILDLGTFSQLSSLSGYKI